MVHVTFPHLLVNCLISKHKFAVVCSNVCSKQIFLGSISSFMRVYIYRWDDEVREYSWNFFHFENFMCKYSSLKFYNVIKIKNF